MLKLIYNKDDSLFKKKKLASSQGALKNDAKFRFAIYPQIKSKSNQINQIIVLLLQDCFLH